MRRLLKLRIMITKIMKRLAIFTMALMCCAFTREGNIFTINAVWAYGPVDGSYGLYTYATEMFKWTEGCPVK